ncbi:hypothetical protein F8388_013553 [Cannabis sativa]|uniref:RNase H type-1 domain-containing protein n=1 Tax=Cannabis sativa TaxID=3483 RepID=A0A7J6G8P3_CANSA|nr:hypothetical protein F8388_013553 [Cannabis sativa]
MLINKPFISNGDYGYAVGQCKKGEACEYRHSWGSNGFQELASLPKTLTKVPRKLQIDEVSWFPPPQNFIKINTDGAAKGRSNEASCGGVFRDCNGTILGAFSSFLGNKTSLEAELYGVIKAINIACANQWHCVWLEVDSILTLSMIANNKTDVPITIREEWLKTLQQIQTMNLIYSHIYREGNQVADLLANHVYYNSYVLSSSGGTIGMIRHNFGRVGHEKHSSV